MIRKQIFNRILHCATDIQTRPEIEFLGVFIFVLLNDTWFQ